MFSRRFKPRDISNGRRCLHSLRPTSPFKILFLGRDEFSCLVLDELHKNRDIWQEILVATHSDQWVGRRGSQLSISPLKLRAQELGLEPQFLPSKPEFRHWLPPDSSPFISNPLDPSNVIITASFGRLISNNLLHKFSPTRRLNVHPSLLPLYRGPAPIQRFIADGGDETGVCVVEMKEKRFAVDGGEIWGSRRVEVSPQSDFSSLQKSLGSLGGSLLVEVLRGMLHGTIPNATPQDDSKATRAPFVTVDDVQIDFKTWDAQKIDRMSRALAHQKPLIAILPSGKALQLHAPKPVQNSRTELPSSGSAKYDPSTRSLLIRCANDSLVEVPFVKQQDRSFLAAKEWWNGVRRSWLTDGVLMFQQT
ncbi:Formyltransferase [Schizopora paradoxa]|uniref:Formyltransferase n=1 Tax=Schizopora paradoxa TaxID=27342 RepID=A0A0H2S583_9AGAM|nr:Formyltransferase [Schizopora paradoxa]